MLLDLNFDARFGILSLFCISFGHICYYFQILIFWPPMLLIDQKCGWGTGHIFFFGETVIFDKLIVIIVKNASHSVVRSCV